MGKSITLLFLLVCLGLSGCTREEVQFAFALEREMSRIATQSRLWPGYNPLAVPLAVFDGTNTHLFRHPSPPKEFLEKQGAYVFEGRHPAVIANSSAQIGGVATATILVETPLTERTLSDIAALALHEAFHVFQGAAHPGWGANEVYLFIYPVDDADALILRRVETEALRRAFVEQEPDAVAGWAQLALDARGERFDQIDSAFAAYERGIELMEGTATYVEYKVAGQTEPDLPVEGFAPEDVRSRAYTTGVALALLLDRFDLGWRERFEAHESQCLDSALGEALHMVRKSSECRFAESELTEIARVARADIETLLVEQARRRAQFESAPGWQLVVEADKARPLWPQGFDPSNVCRVKAGLLHTRFLRLGNETGTLEVMGDTVLTEGVGPHPLFNGIHRLMLTGLEDEPEVGGQQEHVVVSLPTFRMEFRGASVQKSGKQVCVRLEPKKD